jgi:hypothetical protein
MTHHHAQDMATLLWRKLSKVFHHLLVHGLLKISRCSANARKPSDHISLHILVSGNGRAKLMLGFAQFSASRQGFLHMLTHGGTQLSTGFFTDFLGHPFKVSSTRRHTEQMTSHSNANKDQVQANREDQ